MDSVALKKLKLYFKVGLVSNSKGIHGLVFKSQAPLFQPPHKYPVLTLVLTGIQNVLLLLYAC